MDYEKLLKIASKLEDEVGIANDIDERVEQEKENTDVPEPVLEASEEDKKMMAYLEACEKEVKAQDEKNEEKVISAAEQLVKMAYKLRDKKAEITDNQMKQLQAKTNKIAKSLKATFGNEEEQEEEDALTRPELTKKINQKFTKKGKLLIRLDWKRAPAGITPQSKLRDLTLDQLRELLTIVK